MSSLTPVQPVVERGDREEGSARGVSPPAAAVNNPGGVSPQLPQNGKGAGAPNHATFRVGGCRDG